MHVHSSTSHACHLVLPIVFALNRGALALKNDIFSGSLRLSLRVIFWLCFFKTFLGNYIYSLVDAKYARDIQPLSIEPIIAGNFKRFFFFFFHSSRNLLSVS